MRCAQELCQNWSGDGNVCPCALFDPDVDDGADLDPCNHCPHDNTVHRGDGCLYCGCDVPQ